MNFHAVEPDKSISLFVKSILCFEETDTQLQTVLPFFADGYPGLMFQETEHGLLVNPHNKQMPLLFLYGQTIKPIELVIQGKYKLIVFQLYPFVLKSFFNVTARDINDNCYDLQQVDEAREPIHLLNKTGSFDKRIEIVSNFLYTIFQKKKEALDFNIKQAIQVILDNKGQIPVKTIAGKVNLTERTFERRFLNEVGMPPKQFAQIIQFQQSFEQLTLKDFTKLTDIVYTNGFADQSHFTRVFKMFTGKTPKHFTKKLS